MPTASHCRKPFAPGSSPARSRWPRSPPRPLRRREALRPRAVRRGCRRPRCPRPHRRGWLHRAPHRRASPLRRKPHRPTFPLPRLRAASAADRDRLVRRRWSCPIRRSRRRGFARLNRPAVRRVREAARPARPARFRMREDESRRALRPRRRRRTARPRRRRPPPAREPSTAGSRCRSRSMSRRRASRAAISPAPRGPVVRAIALPAPTVARASSRPVARPIRFRRCRP